MTQQEIDRLFDHNVQELNRMNSASAAMIKGLIQGIESNGPAYITLSNAIQDGHKVDYEHVEGDETLVGRVGRSLGLIVTANTLETRHA
jgi:hypothetical protein